jgi:hypothetical protein
VKKKRTKWRKERVMRLKQIRMRAGMVEGNFSDGFINFIYENPIALNMALKGAFPFAVQGVVLAFRRKGLLIDDQSHYLNKFCHILTAFFGKGKFLFEFAGSIGRKHQLAPQVCQQFFNRFKMLTGYLPAHHGIAFFDSGDGFGVKAQLASFGIAVLGADRAVVTGIEGLISGSLSRPKGQNSRPFRYFAGNVNDRPATSRNGYRLRYGHLITIA